MYLQRGLSAIAEHLVGLRVRLDGFRIKFVYEGHRVKVKVTGAKKRENPYSRNVKFDRQ